MDLVHRGENDTTSQDDQKREVREFGKHRIGQQACFQDSNAGDEINNSGGKS